MSAPITVIYKGSKCDLVKYPNGQFAIAFDGGTYGPFRWAEALEWYQRHNPPKKKMKKV